MKRHTFLTLSTGLILSSIISSCKDEPAPKSERERAQDELYSLNIEAAAYDEQLIMAAQKGSLKRMELLLTAGADANATDMYGYSVLMLAIKSRNPIVVELLLEHGANIHYVDESGISPIIRAAQSNNLPMMPTHLIPMAIPYS